MNITDVRIQMVTKGDEKLKAVASVTIDGAIAVHEIKLIQGKEGIFLSMPKKKDPRGIYTQDIVHPINSEAREVLKRAILEKYQQELEKAD